MSNIKAIQDRLEQADIKPKAKKFVVYFEQVNQTRWEVTAIDRECAIKKAAQLWYEQYGPQRPYVEVSE